MALQDRIDWYRQLEAARERPLVVYMTSGRAGAPGLIAGDVVPELAAQLQGLPETAADLDFLLISDGGDATVAWRIASLIRERVNRFSVLVPHNAFSAATLIALGANEIYMHPYSNLGPTDPQITRLKQDKDGKESKIQFGSEDLAAFLEFVKTQVGLSDQEHLLAAFREFCQEVGAGAIGVAARSAQLSRVMSERLLTMHMKGERGRQKARRIAEALTGDFLHHGYPVSRSEAKELGLQIKDASPRLETLMWEIWRDLTEELETQRPFSPISVLKSAPACGALFAPTHQVVIPANAPPQAAQQAWQQVLQQVTVQQIPPAPYTLVRAVMESPRLATRFVTSGQIFAARMPDLSLKVNVVPEEQGWHGEPLPDTA